MLKTIRVRQEVYDALMKLRRKNESPGECIAHLIDAYTTVELLYASKNKE